jgi:hypothetical protein
VSSWEEAAARAFGPPEARVPMLTGVAPPPPVDPEPEGTPLRAAVVVDGEVRPLIATDHFDLTMIDIPPVGARLLVKQIHRPDAIMLVKKYRPPTVALNERGQAALEKELQLDPMPRPQVRHGTRLLVMMTVRWNDVRWYLVEWECDGEGCIP